MFIAKAGRFASVESDCMPGKGLVRSRHAWFRILTKDLGIPIPEKADLELLHEERNNIQHKYASPSAEDAAFHVDKAMRFLKRFLADDLKVLIEDHVPSEYLEQLGID